MVSAQLQNLYCRAKNNLDRPSPINLGEDALPLLGPSVYLNSTRDGTSIPGYVLCMVYPLHARAFNLKMQRAANTQRPHKCPHRNGKFRLCPCVWPQQFPQFCQSNLRLFIIGCTINQVQACRGMHVFPSRPAAANPLWHIQSAVFISFLAAQPKGLCSSIFYICGFSVDIWAFIFYPSLH